MRESQRRAGWGTGWACEAGRDRADRRPADTHTGVRKGRREPVGAVSSRLGALGLCPRSSSSLLTQPHQVQVPANVVPPAPQTLWQLRASAQDAPGEAWALLHGFYSHVQEHCLAQSSCLREELLVLSFKCGRPFVLLYHGKNTYPEICCFNTHKCAAQYCGPQGCDTRGLWKLQFTDLKLPLWIRNPPPALFRVMTFMAFVGNCSTVSDMLTLRGGRLWSCL